MWSPFQHFPCTNFGPPNSGRMSAFDAFICREGVYRAWMPADRRIALGKFDRQSACSAAFQVCFVVAIGIQAYCILTLSSAVGVSPYLYLGSYFHFSSGAFSALDAPVYNLMIYSGKVIIASFLGAVLTVPIRGRSPSVRLISALPSRQVNLPRSARVVSWFTFAVSVGLFFLAVALDYARWGIMYSLFAWSRQILSMLAAIGLKSVFGTWYQIGVTAGVGFLFLLVSLFIIQVGRGGLRRGVLSLLISVSLTAILFEIGLMATSVQFGPMPVTGFQAHLPLAVIASLTNADFLIFGVTLLGIVASVKAGTGER